MFGYIKTYPPMLRVFEQEEYKAVYCGMCETLGREYGKLAKLTLSYDFVLLALLRMAQKEEKAKTQKCRCMANPFKKVAAVVDEESMEFAVSCAMLLGYYKCLDNKKDKGFLSRLKANLMLPYFALLRKKAASRYPDLDQSLAQCMENQDRVEKDRMGMDDCADPTSRFLGEVFSFSVENTDQRTILSRMGYLLGRYVYFCDALDDYEKDKKSGDYNPLFTLYSGDILSLEEKQKVLGSIRLTIGELTLAFELLNISHYRGILENIFYLGLEKQAESIAKE